MLGTLLGAVTGFGGAVIPAVMEHFTAKQKSKQKLEERKLELELLSAKGNIDIKMFREAAADKEHERLIEHDIAMSKSPGIMGALQRSVRPVITYMFFALFVAVEVVTIYVLVSSGADITAIKETVWTDETAVIFSSIISFWFGSRAMEKRRK